MPNLLNTPIDFRVTRTKLGTWKRYLYQSGALYHEFTSHTSILGYPLLHFANGRNPETGKIAVARGVIAIGQIARGFLAIGQVAIGVIAVGQVAIGVLAGVGQAACGIIAIGQMSAGVFCIGQFAVGHWSWAQYGTGGN